MAMQIINDAAGVPQQISMRKGWNGHTHVRQGAVTKLVMPMLAELYWGAVIMPNTDPPITTYPQLSAYRREIEAALQGTSDHRRFVPSMSFYLTDTLDPTELRTMAAVSGAGKPLVKYYPRGLTTKSEFGITEPSALWTERTMPYEVLHTLAELGGTLMLHAADGFNAAKVELGPYEQEPHFLRETLSRIREAHPNLRISVEHLSTAEGCEVMRNEGGDLLGCTITPHHLLLDQRDVFRGGIRVHHHCWPAIQTREHAEELRKLVGEGRHYIFAGDDSAPHTQERKECACVAGGLFVAPASLELYIEAFENAGCLERLEDFVAVFGPAFHHLEHVPKEEIILVREPWRMAEFFEFENDESIPLRERVVIPFRADEKIRWQLA